MASFTACSRSTAEVGTRGSKPRRSWAPRSQARRQPTNNCRSQGRMTHSVATASQTTSTIRVVPPLHEPGSVEIGDLLAWLDRHANLEAGGNLRSPSLDRIRPLLDLLGRPQADYPLIHVTGTNGKTSTSRLIAHLLTARGLPVGAYTSPHPERGKERR